ncbi:MAG: hypothetical protein QHH74_16555 [Spirochaetota bacterium]|nr:hypothetical protein [Spirochaetota bacterium]
MNNRKSFLKLERSSSDYIEENSKWEDSYIDKVYEMCKLGSNDQLLAIALDVSPTTIAKWKRNKPEFREAIEKAKAKVNHQVAVAFYLSCIGYDYEETETLESADGKISVKTIKKHKCGDPIAQYRYLTLRQRDEWCDEAGRLNGSTSITINNINNLDLSLLNTEEIKLALKLGIQQKSIGTEE